MPYGDRTGPPVGSRGSGIRSRGGGCVQGYGQDRRRGAGEKCACSKCGKTLLRKRGVPRSSNICPDCGAAMTPKY